MHRVAGIDAANTDARHLQVRGLRRQIELRDPRLLKGRCGACSYSRVCGGSRARAYGLTGDYLAEDDTCAYDPAVGGLPEVTLPLALPRFTVAQAAG